MSSYYDNELISYLDIIDIRDFKIVSQTNSIVALMMKNFCFKYGRAYLKGSKNERYIRSNSNDVSSDTVLFLNELIQKNICNENEKVIYIGDDLTEYGYEFYLYDLLKIIPYLLNDIPQHHYFLFGAATKLLYISFENEIQFGMQWEGSEQL
ncbi:MAG: hypothetical protein NC412_14190 [Roseburia sp.]|nr:hypothetical protein [Roseburia sp.]MCM1279895.1 hypothetical protein [Robinsoniella sp.]